MRAGCAWVVRSIHPGVPGVPAARAKNVPGSTRRLAPAQAIHEFLLGPERGLVALLGFSNQAKRVAERVLQLAGVVARNRKTAARLRAFGAEGRQDEVAAPVE